MKCEQHAPKAATKPKVAEINKKLSCPYECLIFRVAAAQRASRVSEEERKLICLGAIYCECRHSRGGLASGHHEYIYFHVIYGITLGAA